MSKKGDIGEAVAVGGLAVVGVILLIVALFAFSTAITALIVALAWNVFNLHEVVGAEPLSFWQVVGVAIGLNLLRGLLNRGGSTVKVEK